MSSDRDNENAAVMREALIKIVLTATKAGTTMGYDVACGIIRSTARAAIDTPAAASLQSYAPGAPSELLSAVISEMREYASVDMNAEGPRVAKWADRIEEAAKYQFEKIRYFCQVEINSAISDHISSIFMLKVVRDVAQDQLTRLSQTKEKSNDKDRKRKTAND